MNRLLISIGILCLVAGIGWPWLRRVPWGRLPGDILIVRDGFRFSFPVVTCLVVSLVLSFLFWLFRR